MKIYKLILLIVFVAACFGRYASAQNTNARLTGTITDSSGAAVPHVRVTAQNTGTNLMQTVESNDTGSYSFPALPPFRG